MGAGAAYDVLGAAVTFRIRSTDLVADDIV